MADKLFVKFVPWTEYTIENLVNRTIHFSRISQFNDASEYKLFSTCQTEIRKYVTKLKELLQSPSILLATKEIIQTNPYATTDPETKKEIFSHLLEKEFETFGQAFYEAVGLSQHGIFCISDIEIFKHDAASLMFAHYADNFRGLALIYNIKNELPNLKKVAYNAKAPLSVSAKNDDYDKYLDGGLHRLFIDKSKSSCWQHEWRLFGTPGIRKSNDVGLNLKEVLYAWKFDNPACGGSKERLDALKEILKQYHIKPKRIDFTHDASSDLNTMIVREGSQKHSIFDYLVRKKI